MPVVPNSVNSLCIFSSGRVSKIALEPGTLPQSIIELDFLHSQFTFTLGSIPDFVKVLKLSRYNAPLEIGMIPTEIEEIQFGSEFKQPLAIGVIPTGVKKIVFGCNQLVTTIEIIPSTVTDLEWTPKVMPFLQNGVIFPDMLTRLTFGEYIQGMALPSNLEFLKCGFSSIFIGLLPKSLKRLELQNEVQSIEFGSIPETVTSIVFGKKVLAPLVNGIFPPYLIQVSFNEGFGVTNTFPVLPVGIKIVTVLGAPDSRNVLRYPTIPNNGLPKSIESLKFGEHFIQELTQENMPTNLIELEFHSINPQQEIYIPESVPTLKIGSLSFFYDLKIRQKIFEFLTSSHRIQHSILSVQLTDLHFISFDRNDNYIYFLDTKTAESDGFILKSNFISNLEQIHQIYSTRLFFNSSRC
eukprot:gene1546-1951_t